MLLREFSFLHGIVFHARVGLTELGSVSIHHALDGGLFKSLDHLLFREVAVGIVFDMDHGSQDLRLLRAVGINQTVQ